MDKFITSEATHGLNPQSRFFEPLKPSTTALPSTIAFHLIISDPNSDSSLTPNWSMPETLLRVPSHITISGFFSHLREQLPVLSPSSSSSSSTLGRRRIYTHRAATPLPLPSTPSSSTTSSSITTNNNRNTTIPLTRRPKLGSAKLFLMNGRKGLVLPLVDNDAEWDFRHGYARVDLMDKTDAEWRFFKELMMAAGEEFKCYVAVAPAESREFHWRRGLFGRKGL